MGLEHELFKGKRILLAGYGPSVNSVHTEMKQVLCNLVGRLNDEGVVSVRIFDLAQRQLQQNEYDLLITKIGLDSRFFIEESVVRSNYDLIGGFKLVDALRRQIGWKTSPDVAVLMVEDRFIPTEVTARDRQDIPEGVSILPCQMTLPFFLQAVKESLAGKINEIQIPPELQCEKYLVPVEFQGQEVLFFS